MPEELYALNAAQVERLKRVLDAVESGDPRPFQRGRQQVPGNTIVVGILTSPISATTALTGKPKVGTLNIYGFSSTGTFDTGIDELCYSFAPQAATTDRWSVCERAALNGKLVLTTQFCS